MNIFCRLGIHNWDKYGKVQTEKWSSSIYFFGKLQEKPKIRIRQVQIRTCKKCGKMEKRYLND